MSQLWHIFLKSAEDPKCKICFTRARTNRDHNNACKDTCYTWSPKRVDRCEKCANIWKVTSSGRAELENVNYASGDVFYFTSATRVRFSTWTFPSMDKSKVYGQVQKTALRFLIHRVLTNLASCVAGILKAICSTVKHLIFTRLKFREYGDFGNFGVL